MQGAAQRRQYLGELIETNSPRVRLDLGDAGLPDANHCAKLTLRQSAALPQRAKMLLQLVGDTKWEAHRKQIPMSLAVYWL
jgi:hypothetical protein